MIKVETILGKRIIKTAIAAGLAILIAQGFGFERAAYASIIAIISVQRSLFLSVNQAYKKLGSIVLGSFIGAIFAFNFGQNPLAVAIAVYLIIHISIMLKWEDNIVIISITTLNLMAFPGGEFFIYARDQFLLGLIGALCGTSLNFLFSPYHKNEVETVLFAVEEKSRELLLQILEAVLGNEQINIEEARNKLQELQEKVKEGIKLSKLLQEEQKYRFIEDTPSENYKEAFRIFSSQTDRLEDLLRLSEKVTMPVPYAIPIVKVGRITAGMQKRLLLGKSCQHNLFLKAIKKLEKDFEVSEMPRSRQEFITRASLFYIFAELKKYYTRACKLPVIKEV